MEERKTKMCISDILSRAFNLCKDNFVEIIKAIGVFIAPGFFMIIVIFFVMFSTLIFSLAFDYSSYSNVDADAIFNGISTGAVILIFLIFFISIILMAFGNLVITKILDSANKGEKVSWIGATKYVWNKKWSLLGLNILAFLILYIGILALLLLSVLLSFITLGIGLIIIIPLILTVFVVVSPLLYLFNSTFMAGDLGVIDSIKETFLLFRKGYFWSTVGKLASISGISIGLSIGLLIFSIIPIIGFIVTTLGSYIITAYTSAYLNVFALDRIKPDVDSFGENNIDNKSGDNFIDPII